MEPLKEQAPVAADDLSPTRRAFYLAFINGVMGLIGLCLAVPAVVYLLVPPKLRQKAQWVETEDLSSIPAGTPTEVAYDRMQTDGWKVTTEKATAWVVKNAGNNVVAFAPQCTHLGCAYHWDDPSHTFVCPCHNSVFSIDGKVLSGPAPRPLDRYMVRVEAGKLEIGPLETHA